MNRICAQEVMAAVFRANETEQQSGLCGMVIAIQSIWMTIYLLKNRWCSFAKTLEARPNESCTTKHEAGDGMVHGTVHGRGKFG